MSVKNWVVKTFASRRRRGTYQRGSIGLSHVSETIKKDYGAILSRRERKALAKQQGVPFKAYYNR